MSRVEIVTQSAPAAPPAGGRRWTSRIRVFLLVFGLAMALGQTLNLSRPAVYRGSATVLTVARPAVDEVAVAEQLDVQHVAIQRQLLLGRPLLEEVLRQLSTTGTAERYGLGAVSDFQHMLAVAPVPSTHLVELMADGPEPQLLPQLVNTWIEAYLVYRETAIEEEVGETLNALADQYTELGGHIEAKRREIEAFRQLHDILSEGRTENQAHAALKGLNDALNRAREQQVAKEAELTAVEGAVEAGEPIVPDSEKSRLVTLQVELKTLEQELATFRKRYTDQYAMVNERYKKLPDEIDQLKGAIANTIEKGRAMLLADARHQLRSANAAVLDLERRLAAHKQAATEFTTRFAQYEAMADDLKGLEELYREVEQRKAAIESKSLEKYPQVQVVEWAYTPTRPLHPDYLRDGILVLVGSVVLGLFAVWLLEYLSRRPPASAESASALTGIRFYSEAEDALPAQSPASPALPRADGQALSSPPPRELTPPEMEGLWRNADRDGRVGLALLLSGLSEQEAELFEPADFDPQSARLQVRGTAARQVAVAEGLQDALTSAAGAPEALDAQIRLLAYDTGLPYPEQVDAGVVRHSYILYLVRQGARLRDLQQIIGPLPPQTLTRYGPYSPKGAGRPLEDLETAYPLG
jgi:succinoglycan biosynthesis transport protein ExoP